MNENSEQFKLLLSEWDKFHSSKRNRDYFFNASTGKSLWTLDEVKSHIQSQLVNTSPDTHEIASTSEPTSSSSIKAPAPKIQAKLVRSKTKRKRKRLLSSTLTPQSSKIQDVQMNVSVKANANINGISETDDQDVPMEIDDILENVSFIYLFCYM